MNHPIRHLRDAQLDDKLQAQLAPIIDAYRPHDKPLNVVQLREQFGPPCTTILPLSFDEICKQVDIIRKKNK